MGIEGKPAKSIEKFWNLGLAGFPSMPALCSPYNNNNTATVAWLPHLAITGIVNNWEIFFSRSFLFECCGRSSFVRPWTAMAAIPQLSKSLHNCNVFSSSWKTRILQVMGLRMLLTSFFKIALALSTLESRATPIPPLTENSFGQPMLISMPATSFSLETKYGAIVSFYSCLVNWVSGFLFNLW